MKNGKYIIFDSFASNVKTLSQLASQIGEKNDEDIISLFEKKKKVNFIRFI